MTPNEIWRFDLFKATVLLALVAVLVALIAVPLIRLTPPPTPRPTATVPASTTVPPTSTGVPVTPAAPTLTSPAPGTALDDSEVALVGTGAPGYLVQVLIDGEVVGLARADSAGQWTLEVRLGESGSHAVTLQTVDAAGAALASSDPITLTVAAPAPPSLTRPAANENVPSGLVTFGGTGKPGSIVQLTVDDQPAGLAGVKADGQWSLSVDLSAVGPHTAGAGVVGRSGKVLASSAPVPFTIFAAAAVPTINLPEGKTPLPGGKLTLTGTGEPGTDVEILDNGAVIGVAKVGPDGKWSFTYQPGNGDHNYSVRVSPTQSSLPIPTTIINLTLDSPVDKRLCVGGRGQDLGDVFIVGRCDTLSLIAQRIGFPRAALVAANPQIADPNIIHTGQIIKLPPREP